MWEIVQDDLLSDPDSSMDVWPAQLEFLMAEEPVIGMFTGAGYGKTKILCWRALIDHTKQDGWWDVIDDPRVLKTNPLRFILGAPSSAYIVHRLFPEMKDVVRKTEQIVGRQLTMPTGRNRDGVFDSGQKRQIEMANGLTIIFQGMDKEESAVATDAAGLYIDEATMMVSQPIWTRATMRVRDPRAKHKTIACTGTPELGHFLREEFFDPFTGKTRPGYRVFEDATINNPMIDMNFFRRYQNVNSNFVDMQVFGKWVQGQGGERFAHLFNAERHLKRVSITPQTPGAQFIFGWDPGYATGHIVVAYHKRSANQIIFVDELPVKNLTTYEQCDILVSRGYHARHGNIQSILMDPNDAGKRKSNSKVTDAQIVYEKLGIRPKYTDVLGYNAELRTRNDVLAEMLESGRLLFSDRLAPLSRRDPGVINSILNYELKPVSKSEEASYVDKPTSTTIKLWKHGTDATHYILMELEKEVYRRVRMGTDRAKINARRVNARNKRSQS
jgi:hypothetical protein